MENEKCNVFVRDWWKGSEFKREPYPGAPRKYLARGVSEKLAREICKEYNTENEPGRQIRKAEYEAA